MEMGYPMSAWEPDDVLALDAGPIAVDPKPPESLVKYGAPLSLDGQRYAGGAGFAGGGGAGGAESKDDGGGAGKRRDAAREDRAITVQGPDGEPLLLQPAELLNLLLPPREWAADEDNGGGGWMQYCADAPPTRVDVLTLQEQLDARLRLRQARDGGICPVREELYSQCFDELVRQVALECPERGLLLLRVRDEIRMRIAAYQTLYHSSVAFGVRKSIEAEEGVGQKELKIAELEDEASHLRCTVLEISNKIKAIEKNGTRRRMQDRTRRDEEKAHLNDQIGHLKGFLEVKD